MFVEIRTALVSAVLSTMCLLAQGHPDEPDYEQALARWPDMKTPVAFLGVKHHPDEFAFMWNGNVSVKTGTLTDGDRRWLSERSANSLQISFSVADSQPDFTGRHGEDPAVRASLQEGFLPIVQIEHRKGDVVILQEAFAADAEARGSADWDENVYLRIRFTVVQPGTGRDPLKIWAQVAPNHTRYAMRTFRNVRIDWVAPLYPGELQADGGRLVDSRQRILLHCEQPLQFHPQMDEAGSSEALREAQMDRNLLEFMLPRERNAVLDLVIPFQPASAAQVNRVLQLDHRRARQSIASFWQSEVSRGMQVEVPDEALNLLWRFHAILSFITADSYPDGEVVMKISPDHYEAYWPTPNAMQFVELARQGYFEEVVRYLEPFLDETRRRPVPNTGASFSSSRGFISGPDDQLSISWVSDHGAILWAVAETCLLTRDRALLEKWLPTLLSGLEWIAREREVTARRGGIDSGLMPAGRAMDADAQGNFVWSDAWVYRGLAAVAELLREIGHEQAERWSREQEDYRRAFSEAFRKAGGRTMRWQDSVGNSVPFVPWELSQRGDTNLHAYYLDTGPLILGVCDLVDARDETMDWTLKWFTEGPDAGRYSPYWSDFAERSSLPFEMSSAEPCYSWNVELRYLRNERERFLEGFYSLAAGSVSRRFLGGVETRDGIQALPVMNSVINGHLRRMLVQEDREARGLHVLRNSPGAWLAPGRRIRVQSAPTRFGPFNMEVTGEEGGIRATITAPAREPVEWIRLYVRHPEGRPISRITVNGKLMDRPVGPIVEIPGPAGEQEILVGF